MSRTFNYSGTPSLKENQKAKEIETMTRGDFERLIVGNIFDRFEFNLLKAYGPDGLTEEQCADLITTLQENGIKHPICREDLRAIAYAIADRITTGE